jgi:carbamoyl-phosphate synthase small subunit
MNTEEAILLLEDGMVFHGKPFGAPSTAVGEVVFHTGMTGYQEIFTDPSYKGQIVTMTYPHIGNTGMNDEDGESGQPQIEGLIVREYTVIPSNYRSQRSLDHYLKENGICGMHQLDTRRLTRHIREKGSMMGVLSNEGRSLDELRKMLRECPRIEKRDLVQYVTTSRPIDWKETVSQKWYYEPVRPLGRKNIRIIAYDLGIKQNILRLMTALGFQVSIVPASTSAQEIDELKPDGLFLSNGPGDPEGVGYVIDNIEKLVMKYPVFGICLGHQILALALGAKTYKLKFGHHGSNHPVRNIAEGNVEITAQNHNFAVNWDSLKGTGLEVTHQNLNDGTVEGMRHRDLPVFSVQYHPEASPGPHDSMYLFKQFYNLIGGEEFKVPKVVSG